MEHTFLKDKEEIKKWLKFWDIKNYQLNPDYKYGFIVNCNESVYLPRIGKSDGKNKIEYFPVKFGYIKGDFDCSSLGLKSLIGAPEIVDGEFVCRHNKLKTLVGGPKKVKGGYHAASNFLTSLEGSSGIIHGDFDCSDNELKNLMGAPETIGDLFYFSYNPIESLEGGPIVVGGNYTCMHNSNPGGLQSLEYFPQHVGGLVRLDGAVGEQKIMAFDLFEDVYAFHLDEVQKKKIMLEKDLLIKGIRPVEEKVEEKETEATGVVVEIEKNSSGQIKSSPLKI